MVAHGRAEDGAIDRQGHVLVHHKAGDHEIAVVARRAFGKARIAFGTPTRIHLEFEIERARKVEQSPAVAPHAQHPNNDQRALCAAHVPKETLGNSAQEYDRY